MTVAEPRYFVNVARDDLEIVLNAADPAHMATEAWEPGRRLRAALREEPRLVLVNADDLRWLLEQVRDGYLPDPDAPTYNRLLEAI